MGIILGGIIVCFVICIVILVALSSGRIRQFIDEEGNILENSIAERCFAEINGAKLGMIIKGQDTSNPILLFVHGGPGMPEYFLTKDYPTGLEEYFTVAWWDQRGAGLSYSSDINKEDMTIEQFVEDTIAVTNFLREKFGQEKIYLMGHSWGSFIAIEAAQKAPELYEAYIGVGQITNQIDH